MNGKTYRLLLFLCASTLYLLLFLDYGSFETWLSYRNVMLLCDELLGAVYHGLDCSVESIGVSQWSEMAPKRC